MTVASAQFLMGTIVMCEVKNFIRRIYVSEKVVQNINFFPPAPRSLFFRVFFFSQLVQVTVVVLYKRSVN